MKIRQILFGLMVTILVAGLTIGCASKVATPSPGPSPTPKLTPTPTSTPTPAPKIPKRLSVFTMLPGGSLYMYAVGHSTLINRYTELNTIVQTFPGAYAGGEALHKGEVDFGYWALDAVYFYAYGKTSAILTQVTPSPEFRILMGGSVRWSGWFTRPDTGIKTIPDLKGRTVTYAFPGLKMNPAHAEGELRAFGMDPANDVKHVAFDSSTAGIQGVIDGKIDAVFTAISGSKIVELKAAKGIVVLPFPLDKMALLDPSVKQFMTGSVLPAGYLTSIDKETPVSGEATMLICRSDLDEQAAYTIVKTIMEQGKELIPTDPDFREWGTKERALNKDLLIVPIHPGAIRYFKEIGLWTPEYEALNKQALDKLPK